MDGQTDGRTKRVTVVVNKILKRTELFALICSRSKIGCSASQGCSPRLTQPSSCDNLWLQPQVWSDLAPNREVYFINLCHGHFVLYYSYQWFSDVMWIYRSYWTFFLHMTFYVHMQVADNECMLQWLSAHITHCCQLQQQGGSHYVMLVLKDFVPIISQIRFMKLIFMEIQSFYFTFLNYLMRESYFRMYFIDSYWSSLVFSLIIFWYPT